MYQKSDKSLWNGRRSDAQLYLHEKIECVDLENEELRIADNKVFALLGYSCDEGVKRNNGRIGAADGPDAIRKMLSSLSNHFPEDTKIVDFGNIVCSDGDLVKTQMVTSGKISQLIKNKKFSFVLGGGHDLGYAHYNGIKKSVGNKPIGIINLDAHFDLRTPQDQGNSGTPFYQIAKEDDSFNYLCLGIQEASNNSKLFKTAKDLQVQYILAEDFNMANWDAIFQTLTRFMENVDHIYLTIDLDGFSSAIAPGVSAPSPFGFSLDVALKTLQCICTSQKLISTDVVELNPRFDLDNCTARLAARLIYKMMQWL